MTNKLGSLTLEELLEKLQSIEKNQDEDEKMAVMQNLNN